MINWSNTYMNIAHEIAEHSKCAAKKVGCILVRDGNILATGVNGTFPKAKNCCDMFRKKNGVWYMSRDSKVYVPETATKGRYEIKREWIKCLDQEAHHKWSLINEVHAEMNALAKANRNGTSVVGATAYITHSPCYNCAKSLYSFGIDKIIYDESYDGIEEVQDLLGKYVYIRGMRGE